MRLQVKCLYHLFYFFSLALHLPSRLWKGLPYALPFQLPFTHADASLKMPAPLKGSCPSLQVRPKM